MSRTVYDPEKGMYRVVRTEEERRAVYSPSPERVAELLTTVTALPLSDVDREELAIELCRTIGSDVYQLVDSDIDAMCGIVGIHGPEGWLTVADALLAKWRVVRR